MSHPFFEANQFPAQREDARTLFDLLVVIFSNPGEIRMLYQRSGGDVGILTPGLAPRLLWTEALNLLAAGRTLEQFCDEVKRVQRVQRNAELLAAVDAVMNAKPLVDQQVVRGKRLVLDRAELRNKLRALASETAPLRVVLVRGGEDTGKSWGRHVFLGAAVDRGAVGVYLSANQSPTLDSVTGALFAPFGATDKIPPRGLTTGTAWYDAVCTALSEVTGSRGQQLWAAIDDIALIDPEIGKFCDQFVAKMENPAFSEWFRLMLIHYPPDRSPTTWQDDVWDEDTTSEDDVQLDEVRAFLKTWAADRGYTFLDADIDELARVAIEAADTPPPQQNGETAPRLKRLHDHLVKTLEEQARRFSQQGPADGP
jgi:hypothetical protein